jgi:acetyl-CoA carboxylase carboxyltransferase component
MTMDEKITRALGLRHIEVEEVAENPQSTEITQAENISSAIVENEARTEIQKEHISDIEKAQENIKNLIDNGTEAFESLVALAKSSESPGAFTVLAATLETLVNANKDFISVSEKKKFAKEEVPANTDPDKQTNITNNNLIISTSEMLKMFKGES